MFKNLKTSHLIGLTMFVVVVLVIIISAVAKASPKTEDPCFETALQFQQYMKDTLEEKLRDLPEFISVKVDMKMESCNKELPKVVVLYTVTVKMRSKVAEDGGSRMVTSCLINELRVTFTLNEENKMLVKPELVSEDVKECK